MGLQYGVARQYVKVDVPMKDGYTLGDGYGGDKAIDELAYGLTLAAAVTIERGSFFVVGGSGGEYDGASHKPAQVA